MEQQSVKTPEQLVQEWIVALLTQRSTTPVCDYAHEEWLIEHCALAIEPATYGMVRRELAYLVAVHKICKYSLYIKGAVGPQGVVYALPTVPTYRSL